MNSPAREHAPTFTREISVKRATALAAGSLAGMHARVEPTAARLYEFDYRKQV